MVSTNKKFLWDAQQRSWCGGLCLHHHLIYCNICARAVIYELNVPIGWLLKDVWLLFQIQTTSAGQRHVIRTYGTKRETDTRTHSPSLEHRDSMSPVLLQSTAHDQQIAVTQIQRHVHRGIDAHFIIQQRLLFWRGCWQLRFATW